MLVTRGLGCGSSGHEKWTGWGGPGRARALPWGRWPCCSPKPRLEARHDARGRRVDK